MPTAKILSRRERELSVLCEDRPGMLSHLAQVLRAAKVNIIATCCTTAGMQGALRIIVDKPKRAVAVLDEEHLPYSEHDVLYVELPNSPGALADFAGKLAAQHINITRAYGTAVKKDRRAIIVFKVSDLDKALAIR